MIAEILISIAFLVTIGAAFWLYGYVDRMFSTAKKEWETE